MENFLDRFK